MTWTNDTGKAIYRDQAGNIVDEGDPNAAFLVVHAGGTLPMDKARKYGLVKEEAPAPAEKSVKAPAENKAIKHKEDK